MSSCEHIIVVISKTQDDAVVRLQSDAVVRGLRECLSPATTVLRVDSLKEIPRIPANACVLFHYDDTAAIMLVRSLAAKNAPLTIACLASDVYSYDQYLAVHDMVDLYLAPTALHRSVLQSQVYKPVYLLHECIDPTSLRSGAMSTFPNKKGTRILWFGYPESFEKGMVSLIPVLKAHEASGTITSFTLILGTERFDNRFGLRTMPYDKDTFAAEAACFDYCLLSHLPLDLALNSYIKSPNKLITALFSGLIPLASKTPSYQCLLAEFGLERFLFESPADLSAKLASLNPVVDSRAVRESGILEAFRVRYSDEHIAQEFLQILESHSGHDTALGLESTPETLRRTTPQLHIVQLLRDLVPSILREFRSWRARN